MAVLVLGEAELEDAALGLDLLDQVDRAQGRLERRAGVVVVEEVGVEVERVEQVELDHVDQVDAHRPVLVDHDRVLHVMEGDRVDRVDLVGTVEVGIEGVHHHHQLLPLLRLGVVRMALLRLVTAFGRIRVDDERTVQPLVQVPLQGRGVAVVEVDAERFGGELVGVRVADLDIAATDSGHTIVVGAVDAVEVHRVRVAAGIDEVDAEEIALVGPQRRTRHAAVVGPGREEDARRDLDLLVVGHDLPLAHSRAIGAGLGDGAVVEIGQDIDGVPAEPGDIDIADGQVVVMATVLVLHGASAMLVIMRGRGRS